MLRTLIAGIILTMFVLSIVATRAQEGHYGQGHDTWHQPFYEGLKSPQTLVSCCNLADCRPTSGRTVGDHHEVKINGDWIAVIPGKIVKKSAPDLGYHVCAPALFDGDPEKVFCVVVPPEI